MAIKLFDRKNKKILFKRIKMIIYKIFYKEWKVFDISLKLIQSDVNPDEYYSEIHSYVVPEGFAHYVFDKVKTKEELNKVIFRFGEIDDLRIVLWESPFWENYPLNYKEAKKRETEVFRPFFETEMKRFCDEFGLTIFTD